MYLWDQLWIVFVTVTTTGYGDFVAGTHIGRLACCGLMGKKII
ncbi:MAG: ion channel [Promethearchaeia archaeon]